MLVLHQGFDPSLVSSKYGDKLYFWDWTTRELIQTISLGAEGACITSG